MQTWGENRNSVRCSFLWTLVLSPLLKPFCYPFSDWLWQVHMVFGLCCDSSTTAWTFDSERRTIWKPELPGSLWTDEIHSGVEDREKECAYIHIRMHTTAHTHTLQFYVKIWFATCKNCNIVISKLFVFLFLFLKHFQDGRRAQQHIENSWKQLETVSDLSAPITMLICMIPILFKLLSVDCVFRPTSQPLCK